MSLYNSEYDLQLSFIARGTYSVELINQKVINGYSDDIDNEIGEKIFWDVMANAPVYLTRLAGNQSH